MVAVIEPPEPVIVNEAVPSAAELEALIVSVEVPEPPATVLGLKLAVTPEGNPLALKATLALNPFEGVTVTVNVLLLPCATVCEVGDAEREKFPAAFTTSFVVAEAVRLPEVARKVRVSVPAAAPVVVVTVTVEVPELVIVVGLKLAETPEGNPLALSVTVPVNPFWAVRVSV